MAKQDFIDFDHIEYGMTRFKIYTDLKEKLHDI